MILAVTGLGREARILAGAGVVAIEGGGASQQLEQKLEQAAPQVRGIISIGLGGALDPRLEPGDWVVAHAVVSAETTTATDPDWAQRLLAQLPGATPGEVLGVDAIIADTQAKRRLRAEFGAVAVDMESHVAARIAQRHGLPLAVARTISDGAERSLPRAAQAGMRADGGMDVMAVLRSLLSDPRQLPALVRTALDAETAFRALFRGRQRLGPTLGSGPDLRQLPLDVG